MFFELSKRAVGLIARVAVTMTMVCIVSFSSRAEPNVIFEGTLVRDPCQIAPGNAGETLTVDFGNVIDKELYLHQRNIGVPFTIRLVDCDPSLGSSMNLVFYGEADGEQQGKLKVQPLSGAGAMGIAIGFETLDGKPLNLQQQGATLPIQPGTNMIMMRAFVSASPQAIASRNIELGEFQALATFAFHYE